MPFYTIIQNICQQHGTTPTALCKTLGLSTSMVTNWKNGRIPNGATLQKIADFFSVSVDYLLGNDAPATAPASPAIAFTPEEQRIILRYRAMSEETQLIIRKILDIPTGNEELVPVYHAAHSEDGTAEDKIIYRTREEIDRLEKAPETDIDI